MRQSARTAGEKIVAVVCMMIGAASFAYVIGSICGLINSLDTEGIKCVVVVHVFDHGVV